MQKPKVFSVGFAVLLAVILFTSLALPARAGGTQCGEGEAECYRILQNNEIDIFYGKRSPCE